MLCGIVLHLLCLVIVAFGNKACTNDQEGVFEIDLIDFNVQLAFHLKNEANLSSYSLMAIYTWEISVPEGSDYDGLLYKMIDRHRDEPDAWSSETPNTTLAPHRSNVKNMCEGLNTTLWAKDDEWYPVQCKLPCSKYLPAMCGYNAVCGLLKAGYKSLPWHTRRLELPIDFGRIYDLVVLVYKNWFTGKGHQFKGNQIVKYCREELITHHNVLRKEANDFCSDKQNLEDGTLATGPPTLLSRDRTEANLTTNTATVSFRFREPHDISPNAVLLGFNIFVRIGEYDEFLKAHPRDDAHERIDEEYTVTVTNVEFSRMNWIVVVPFVQLVDRNNCSPHCSEYGFELKQYFYIPDIDACAHGEINGRYCSYNAHCVDLPKANRTSALCSCPYGLEGNGINSTYPRGTGCTEVDPCAGNRTCGRTTASSGGNGTACPCSVSHDGTASPTGTKCYSVNLVIALAVTIPVIVLIFVAVVFIMWRLNQPKNGQMRLQEENL